MAAGGIRSMAPEEPPVSATSELYRNLIRMLNAGEISTGGWCPDQDNGIPWLIRHCDRLVGNEKLLFLQELSKQLSPQSGYGIYSFLAAHLPLMLKYPGFDPLADGVKKYQIYRVNDLKQWLGYFNDIYSDDTDLQGERCGFIFRNYLHEPHPYHREALTAASAKDVIRFVREKGMSDFAYCCSMWCAELFTEVELAEMLKDAQPEHYAKADLTAQALAQILQKRRGRASELASIAVECVNIVKDASDLIAICDSIQSDTARAVSAARLQLLQHEKAKGLIASSGEFSKLLQKLWPQEQEKWLAEAWYQHLVVNVAQVQSISYQCPYLDMGCFEYCLQSGEDLATFMGFLNGDETKVALVLRHAEKVQAFDQRVRVLRQLPDNQKLSTLRTCHWGEISLTDLVLASAQFNTLMQILPEDDQVAGACFLIEVNPTVRVNYEDWESVVMHSEVERALGDDWFVKILAETQDFVDFLENAKVEAKLHSSDAKSEEGDFAEKRFKQIKCWVEQREIRVEDLKLLLSQLTTDDQVADFWGWPKINALQRVSEDLRDGPADVPTDSDPLTGAAPPDSPGRRGADVNPSESYTFLHGNSSGDRRSMVEGSPAHTND